MPVDKLALLRDEHAANEYSLLRQALEEAEWSQQKAAALLGCSTSTLYRAIGRHPRLREGLELRGLTRRRGCA